MRFCTARPIAPVWWTSSLAALAIALPITAVAQQQPAARGEAPPPPQLEKLEEGKGPEANPQAPPQTTITEQRANGGKVQEVRVSRGKNTYVLKPNEQPGTFPGDGQSDEIRGAQWPVLQFDWGRTEEEKKRRAAAEAAGKQPPPPPPPPAQK